MSRKSHISYSLSSLAVDRALHLVFLFQLPLISLCCLLNHWLRVSQALPSSARKRISNIAPSSLSDLDLLVMIDYNREPALQAAAVFDQVHSTVVGCAERALDNLIGSFLNPLSLHVIRSTNRVCVRQRT